MNCPSLVVVVVVVVVIVLLLLLSVNSVLFVELSQQKRGLCKSP